MQPKLWYYAQSFDTREEAQNFTDYMRTALYERPDNDELLCLNFGTPRGNFYALIIGFPTETTKAAAGIFADKPTEILSREDIDYALAEITRLRQQQGVSDVEMAHWSQQHGKALGLPDNIIKKVIADYGRATELDEAEEKAFTRIGLDTEIMEKYKGKPFLLLYLEQVRRHIDDLAERAVIDDLPESLVIADIEKEIIRRKLKRADKYQFDASALAMLKDVYTDDSTWIPLENHLWIEFQEPLELSEYNPNDRVKALWLHFLDNLSDLQSLTPKNADLDMRIALLQRNNLYKSYCSIEVVTEDGYELFDLNYDLERQIFPFLFSHRCPWNKCVYEDEGGWNSLGSVSPCEKCISAIKYWAATLHTCIRMINREFAFQPVEPPPHPIKVEAYEEEATVKVGKGKNSKKIKQWVKREVEFRVVSYEVSEISPETRERMREIAEEGSKGNWMTTYDIFDPSVVVWEHKKVKFTRGRTLDPERNPRWKTLKTVPVKTHLKWYARLRRKDEVEGEQLIIHRTTAHRYAKKEDQQ